METYLNSLLAPTLAACPCALGLDFSCGPSSPEHDASSAVRVDTLKVPHLLNKDETHMRRFSQMHCRLSSSRHRCASEVLHP